MTAPLPVPLYQGAVNTWECDEGGHLNVRFHFERALAGLALMASAMGMKRAFVSDATATLLPIELHARFLKEARPGEGLIMHGGVTAFEENTASLCLDMRHADGAPASAFSLRVAHVEPRKLKSFPWSARARAAAARFKCAAPTHAQARSIDAGKAGGDVSLKRANELGAARIGGFLVTPDQCDAFGRLRAEHVFGRISDAIPHLLGDWRRALIGVAGAADPAGAVVEARILYRRWPLAGDLIEVRSGIVEVGEKTIRLVHWLLDPETGAAWASVEAVSLTFDAATRKTIAPPAAARAAAEKRVIKGMGI